MKKVRIIGAGLAGCEAAYQLAKRGYLVELFEAKKLCPNEVQKTSDFAELVCSNSLRSNSLLNAVGTLKEEMRILDSLIIRCADLAQIPAGGSLAVDRNKFSGLISAQIRQNPLIEIYETEFSTFDLTIPTIIATGPLTTSNLQKEIQKLIGNSNFYFFDAVAPIIKKDSINMKIAFKKNRYDKGETADYYNCPMNQEEYEKFYQALITGETAISHLPDEQQFIYFEGCMPIEVMAKRGQQTLLFGPLKPRGLHFENQKHHAVVQLRQDDASDSLYNLVGFQTNLKWNEQKRIFSLIPGLEQAKFVRYGVMHKNNFLNSPLLLNEGLQLKSSSNIFFAGQITGVEGYVESAMSGLFAAINLDRYLQNKKFLLPDKQSVSGSLIHYILNASSTNFQPMKANWGITDELTTWTKHEGKEIKKQKYSQRALEEIKKYLKDIA